MTQRAKRLGRGLSSLLSHPTSATEVGPLTSDIEQEPPAKPRYRVSLVPITEIRPNPKQPRRTIHEDGLRQLSNSIRDNGLLQPVVVRPVHGRSELQPSFKYELIAGERRLRAAERAGLSDVTAIVRDVADQQVLELALVENIQREDLNPLDKAQAYAELKDRFGLSPEDIGQRVGEDRTTVTNYLRILELPEPIREMVAGERITMGHARALAGVKPTDHQMRLANAVVSRGLSVRALEETVRRGRSAPQAPTDGPPPEKLKRPHIRDLEQRFSEKLQTKVIIHEGRKKNSGRISIEYNSLDDFDRVCEMLGIRSA